MDGEPQYVGVESPRQVVGAWLTDLTVVLVGVVAFMVLDPTDRTLGTNTGGWFIPAMVAFGFLTAMVLNGGVLRGLTGGSIGDHLFDLARVNPLTYRRLGVGAASRYSLAPVYELFFHSKAEQSRFRCRATIVARRYLGRRPDDAS